MMENLKNLLRDGGYSLVVENGGVRTFTGMGVSDLFRLLSSEPGALRGAVVADKVVGKAAASLMALGGVSRAYAEVVSRPGLEMLSGAGVEVSYGELVDHIVNRSGSGMCPLEARCSDCQTPAECLERVTSFISEMRGKTGK